MSQEFGQPQEARNGKETNSPLEFPDRKVPH